MTKFTDEEYQRLVAQTSEMYEAVGRFVVEFSRLQRTVERIVCMLVGGGVHAKRVRIVLHGERGPEAARSLAVFFHLTRSVAEEQGADKFIHEVIRALNKEIQGLIGFRNDVAHGAWTVGNLRDLDDERLKAVDWIHAKVERGAAGGTIKDQRMTAVELLAESKRCVDLVWVARLLGFMLLKNRTDELVGGLVIEDGRARCTWPTAADKDQ